MITILHGDNVFESRKQLDRIKSSFEGEIISLDGKNLSETAFIQSTQSQFLFSTEKLVVVENFLSDVARGRNPSEAAGKISAKGDKKKIKLDFSKIEPEIIFWEDKELGKTILDEFKDVKTKVLLFKTPTTIFKFCDALSPKNCPNLVFLLRECLKTAEPEYVFIMIVRQFRLMLNPGGSAPWQQAKIMNQSKSFGQNRLKEIYKKLLEIDYKTKTGQSPQNLEFNLELFLLSL